MNVQKSVFYVLLKAKRYEHSKNQFLCFAFGIQQNGWNKVNVDISYFIVLLYVKKYF